MIDARPYGDAARKLQEDEARSIGTAMLATLAFVAIVLLLLWAGVSDAAAIPAIVHAVATASG
jgi:hypothetical protein